MVKSKTIFEETQEQQGAYIWLLMLGLVVIAFSFMFIKYDDWEGLQKKFGPEALLLLGGIMSLLFLGLFFHFKQIKLETRIDTHDIQFRYLPYKKKFEYIERSQMSSYEVSEYHPVKEYGGWGYKKPGKPRDKNVAYTISGKIALKIKLKNGHIILIGTQRKDALEFALQKLIGEK